MTQLLIPLLLASAALATPAHPAVAPDSVLYPTDGTVPYQPDAPEAVVDGNLDLLIARITAVHDIGATIEHPPRVDLQVIRVIRGAPHRGHLVAVWHSELEEMFSFRCGNETPAESEQIGLYLATAQTGPLVGSRMILAGRSSSDDGNWHVSPYVRFHDRSTYRVALGSDIARIEAGRKTAAIRERQRLDADAAADSRNLRTANLIGLCRASTDIVFASFDPRTHWLTVRQRLYSAPEDSVGLRINARLGVPRTRDHARLQVDLYPTEVPMAERRANWYGVGGAGQGGVPQPGPFVVFLRRQAALQNDDAISYRLADPLNGILPGDSMTVRAVRRIVTRQLGRGPWIPTPPPECGAPIAGFAALDTQQVDRLRLRIMYVRPGARYRARTFQLGVGLSDQERADYPLCSSCGELAWSDDSNTPYSIAISRPAMAQWLATLAAMPPPSDPLVPDSLIVMLTARAPMNGATRAAEIAIYPSDLVRLTDALTYAVRSDTIASRRVNYLKSEYAPLLAPAPGWHLMR